MTDLPLFWVPSKFTDYALSHNLVGIDDEACCVWIQSINIKPGKTIDERKSWNTKHFIGRFGQQLLLPSLYSSAKDGKPERNRDTNLCPYGPHSMFYD